MAKVVEGRSQNPNPNPNQSPIDGRELGPMMNTTQDTVTMAEATGSTLMIISINSDIQA